MNRPTNDHDDTADYEVRIKGHLERRWMARFDGLTVSHENDGTTVISGPIGDQAALHGVLQRVRDLGLPLISVVRLPSQPDPLAQLRLPHQSTKGIPK